MKDFPVVAVVGATGAVGIELLKILSERKFAASEVRALASSRSAGRKLKFDGPGSVDGFITVQELKSGAFGDVDIALFAAGSSISEQYREELVAAGCVMVDNSSAFRMEEGVPLIVPEVNPEEIHNHKGVIANPNCSTIQMVVALAPLHKIAPIKRVVVSTYQAASGAGQAAMDELYEQTREFLNDEDITVKEFAHRIAFNCIPQIDVFLDDGSTKEEWKMVAETNKIMPAPAFTVSATCVRVPVLRCHSESINVEFHEAVDLEELEAALAAAPSVKMMDDREKKIYPMPAFLERSDDVYIGRLRRDESVEHGIAFWCVADQIKKGAALNTVQIAELLLNKRS